MATDIIISTDQSSQQIFGSSDQRMIIEAGILVSVDFFLAVYANEVKNTLINYGFVISGLTGALFDEAADLGVVRNSVGALIQGSTGVEMLGARSTVVNGGAIIGLAGAGIAMDDVTRASVTNTGAIRGIYGVSFENGGGVEGDTLVNSGVVRGASTAVRSALDASATLTVTNQAKGLIAGPLAIGGYGGKLSLVNHGKIAGDIADNVATRTTVRNDGNIAGDIHLGGGDDRFDGRGGIQGEVLGGPGADTLIGGSKADRFDGGSDRDMLTGGGAADRFHFAIASHSAPGANRDVITDFNRGQHDRIDIGDMSLVAFAFRGGQGFLGGGTPSVRVTKENKPGTAHDRTIVHGDASGDGTTDFQIELRGLHALKGTDFIL